MNSKVKKLLFLVSILIFTAFIANQLFLKKIKKTATETHQEYEQRLTKEGQ